MSKINTKHKKFVKALLEGHNQSEAAVKAGYKPSNRRQQGHKLMKMPDVRADLMAAFAEYGITDDLAAKKMSEGLDAMTPPKKDGGDRYEDFFVRKQYLDMYFRLKGSYAPEKSEHVEKKIVLQITPEFLSGLKDARVLTPEQVEIIEGEVIDA